MGLANSLLTRFGNKISGVWKYFQPTPEREDPPTQELSTDSVTNLWDEDLVTDEVETYQSLIRGIRRTSGFRLFFVCCSRSKGAELIAKLAIDLPQRKFATLSITEPIDNLYNRIEELPNLAQIDTLFIQGLEHSIFEYEDREFGDINLRSTTKVYSGTTLGVPPLFAHLNMQRERFRDDFSICFVFLLPDFALNYFVRRAPDFFDWRSQSFQFFTDKDLVDRASWMVRSEGNPDRYPEWTPEKRRDAILKIKECLDESIDPDEQYSLSIKLGNILSADRRYENAIAAFDRALAIIPDDHQAWYNRGVTLGQIGRTEEAIAAYDRVLAIKPDYHEAIYNKACMYALQQQIDLALQYLQQAIKIEPEHNREMARTDSDFNTIRDNARFQELIADS
jgi:hypothetical protein